MDAFVLQGGAFGLCVMMITLLSWIIKDQSKLIRNHLTHIQTKLDSLPCNRGEGCSED